MDTVSATPPRLAVADRFLLGILAGVGVLLALAVGAIILLRQPVTPLQEDTPGGSIQGFLRALDGQDYDRAYAYLAETMADKPTREEFMRYNADRRDLDQATARMRIERESVGGEHATVVVTITRTSTGGPFFVSNDWTTSETFALRREDAGWRITSLPYEYWPPLGLR